MQSVPKVAIRSRGTGERNHVEVTRACGHKEVIEVYGDPAKSQWLDSARLRDCKLCYSQKQQGADEQAVADGKRVALDGTEKQVAWAGTIRQRRAVEFGKAMRDLEALVVAGKVTPEAAKAGLGAFRAEIGNLFRGKVTWIMLDDRSGDEIEVESGSARFWIDTRALTGRDMAASMLPRKPWHATRDMSDWSAIFQPDAPEDDANVEDDDDPFAGMETVDAPSVPVPVPVPAKAPAKAAPKAQVFDDDDVPF